MLSTVVNRPISAPTQRPSVACQSSINRSKGPPAQSVKMAVIAVATLPMLAVYPFVQRFFVKGAMIGSVKG